MKKFKKTLSFLLIAVMVLAMPVMAACGSGSSDEDDVSDFIGCWKYDDYENYLVMYEDYTWQMLDDEGESLINEDFTFDGETVDLLDEDGSVYLSVYFDGGTLTDSDGDTLTPSGWPTSDSDESDEEEPTDFIGCWKYDDYENYLVFYEDYTWQMLDGSGNSLINEDFYYDGETVYMYDEDGDEYLTASFVNGTLTDSDGDTLTPSGWPSGDDDTEEDAEPTDFIGCWKYDDYDSYLVFYEDYTWQMLDDEGDSIFNEDFYYDGETVYMYDEDGDVYLTASFVNGTLTDSDGDTLTPSAWPGN